MTKMDKLPFYSFEEFLEEGTYTLGVGKHGCHFTHIELSRFLLIKITDFSGSI